MTTEPSNASPTTEEDDEGVDTVNRKKLQMVPATYVDTFVVSTWPGHIRITFGESFENSSQFRTAVVLPISDARILSSDIVEMIERQIKKDLERQAKKEQKTT